MTLDWPPRFSQSDRAWTDEYFGAGPLFGPYRALHAVEYDALSPHAEGLARSDTLGPWLYSEAVQADMREYEFR